MAFLTSRGALVTRVVTGSWLSLMLLATLGFGEHYRLDLICAVPFVLAMRALCATDIRWSANPRWSALLIGTLVVVVWGMSVRGVMRPASIPGLVPALAIFTIAISLFAERRLARAFVS